MIFGLEQYKLVFVLLLVAGEGLFCRWLKRRAHWPIRVVLGTLCLLAVGFFFPIIQYNAGYVSLVFLTLFGCSLCLLKFCFDEPWGNILFCGIAGYTVQHLSYLVYTSLMEASHLSLLLLGGNVDPYGSAAVTLDSPLWIIQAVLYVDCYFLVYAFATRIFGARLKASRDLFLGRWNLLFLSGLLIVVDVIFNMITNYHNMGNPYALLVERCYNTLGCVLILALLYNQLSKKELKTELDHVQRLLQLGEKQYALAKENIDLINMKYHDLRHQSEVLSSKSGVFRREEKEELDRVLDEYASIAKTGNEVLDVILTEKSMLCRSKGIQITLMADGQNLGFVKAHHLYALLGNALDNAMDAVQALPPARRLIDVHIKSLGNMVHIHVENYFEGTLSLRDGLPRTTHEDADYHGFGMLSMKTIAETYGGTLTLDVTNGRFGLDVILVDSEE